MLFSFVVFRQIYLFITAEKAQESEEYQDYMSRCGEDNNMYYNIKIQASKLLLDNIDNTFVTPVFNGSASLRDAAGQMIEETTKSIRRKQTVDEAYMEKLFADMISAKHLDQIAVDGSAKKNLGELPTASVILLVSLACVWLLMGLYVVIEIIKKKKC